MQKIKTKLILSLVILSLIIAGICIDAKKKQSFSSNNVTATPGTEIQDQQSQILSQAWKLSRVGNVPNAIKRFTKVLEDPNANRDQKVQALFGLANVYQFSSPSQPQQAQNYFHRIMTDFSGHRVVPWAMLRIAQLQNANDPEAVTKARELYQDILTDHYDSAACDEAVLSLAATYFAENDPQIVQLGLETLEKYLAQNPDNALVTSMLFRLSYWYQEVERNYQKALPHSLRLGELKTCNPKRWAMVYWGLGQIYSIQFGEYDKALPWYERIPVDCPRDYLTYPAQNKIDLMRKKIKTQGEINE